MARISTYRSRKWVRGSILPFLAGLTGVVVGVGGSFVVALPLMRTAIASAVGQAGQHAVTVMPASTVQPDICGEEGFTGKGGEVLGESAGQPQAVPTPAAVRAAQAAAAANAASQSSAVPSAAQAPSINKKVFVTKLTGGALVRVNPSIAYTGPSSENNITTIVSTKTTIANHNDVSLVNGNTQSADSGDAVVTTNTSGGSAESGGASNTNSAATAVHINN